VKEKTAKQRLDLLIVEKGFAESRSKAQAMIMAGQVIVEGKANPKAGDLTPADAVITVKKTNPYVSRGGLKLESALHSLNIPVTGKVCMDIGASTGGFTDCLLQHGAAKVYAVDVGHNQLHPRIKADPRVISLEGVNFRYFPSEILKDPVEFVTIDVSFISLDKILPVAASVSAPGAQFLAMVKPQFEVTPGETKKGVVKDEKIRLKAIDKIKRLSKELNLNINGENDSALKGPEGNLEHFLWLEKQDA
jgi:23S rRNA (cytidine1920-2'-O)/16S rRNA (cytidine1409-2'-O)-methyltransferase